MVRFSAFWNFLVREEESLALFLVLLPVFQRDVGQASSCLRAWPYLRFSVTPRLKRARGGRIHHHHLPKISGSSWEPGIQLENVPAGGSLGAAGRRWCCPTHSMGVPSTRRLQTQVSRSQHQVEHPGSKSRARGSCCQATELQEHLGHSPELFQLGKAEFLLESGRDEHRQPLGLGDAIHRLPSLPLCQFSHTWSSWLSQTSQLTSLTFPKLP